MDKTYSRAFQPRIIHLYSLTADARMNERIRFIEIASFEYLLRNRVRQLRLSGDEDRLMRAWFMYQLRDLQHLVFFDTPELNYAKSLPTEFTHYDDFAIERLWLNSQQSVAPIVNPHHDEPCELLLLPTSLVLIFKGTGHARRTSDCADQLDCGLSARNVTELQGKVQKLVTRCKHHI